MSSKSGSAAVGLDVTHLAKRFGAATVVEDVSFSLGPGQLLTLLGPSGSGKTTTMRMIAGFEQPSAGDVRVGGVSIVDLPVHRRNIGVVFQQYALFPHLSVFDNLAYPLQMRRVSRPEIVRRVGAALELVQLSGFEGRLPKELSGGQQQRVALARAIVFEPQLLLMDEPMGALDKRLREAMQVEIRQLQQTLGITTVSVTHDQIEALVMSDLIAVLDGGVLQQLGPPLEVYRRPANRFVADFLGESNLIAVSGWEEAGGTLRAVTDRGVRIAALSKHARGDAEAAWLIVRPENIVIGDSARQMPNCFDARIEEAIHLGDLVRYRVALDAGPELSVKAIASAGEPWAQGSQVVVGWRCEHSLCVAA